MPGLKKKYSQQDKDKVKQYILEGKSYNEITKILDVPKSTISVWFGKTLKKPMNRQALKEHLTRARKIASAKIKKKWTEWRENEEQVVRENIARELPHYPFNSIGLYKSMLSMLYWAEGSRHNQVCGTKFANTDPKLAKLFLTLLRKCYKIDEEKIRVRLHLHYYHSAKKTKAYWSQILNVPTSQFGKIYRKKRSKTKKFRKNFMGICFISYGNSRIRKELLMLGEKLQEKITKESP